MNCQDLNFVLDTHPPEELSSEQKRDVERHLASCQTCREAWAAYSELVAEQVPETPRHLEGRIESALGAEEPTDASRVRRSILIGSLLLAGSAAAMTLGLAPHWGWRNANECAVGPERHS